MNFLTVGILLILAISHSRALYIGNGRPGCRTEEELNLRIFRNNWDPTTYWKCEQLNEAAALFRCPDEHAFMAATRDCVPWEDWQWQEPMAPISEPYDE